MKLVHIKDGPNHVICEDRGTDVLRRIAVSTEEVDAGPMFDRLVTAFNATEKVPLMRLVGLSSSLAKVRVHEIIAAFDLLIRTNPQMLERLLKRVRGEE